MLIIGIFYKRFSYVVPPGDVAPLTERVCALPEKPDKRRAMGLAAEKWVRREFSTGALIERRAAVYAGQLRRKLG